MDYPSIKDLKYNYPKNKVNRNHLRLWRWLIIGRLGFYLSWIASRLNLTANNITILSFILGLFGIYMLLLGQLFVGLLLINLWYLFDCADGNLARYYKLKSKKGKFLDEALGEIVLIFMWFSIGVGLYRNPDLSITFFNSLNRVDLLIFSAFSCICITLKNCISFRFTNIYNEGKLDEKIVNKDKKVNFLYKYSKYTWISIISFGGLQSPLLLLFSYFDYLGLLVLFYSFLYGIHLFISVIIFANKFN
tara:strand:+ start:58 stop:801 length:744 start_codon:yes stop_codon:yes gene_type:complete